MSSAKLGRQLAAEFRPRPVIYWADLLASAAVGWALFVASMTPSLGVPVRVVATIGAAVALLRAAYFMHEISHLNRRALPGFELGWHLVAGIPLLVPSLMIGAHKLHHRTATYGTSLDPEYAPIASWSRARIALDLASMALVPPALMLRWAVLGPLSWCVPPLRRIVVERMSTMAISMTFRRTRTDGRAPRFIAQELLMCGFVWSSLLVMPAMVLAQWWLVAGLALLLNQVRTYVAHTYSLDQPQPSIDGQVRDTRTLGGALLTELIAPLGDRFHAAHHRFPSLPYHCLAKVHARLLAELPADDPYRETLGDGLGPALREFWRDSGSAEPLPARERND